MFCSSDQRTALHHAARNGHTAACQLLIDAKADVNARDLVSREKMQLQAAAAARIADKPDVIEACKKQDLSLLADHLMVDPTRARARGVK